jgi:UDP-N-acetyl-D-galactosamine dehydrogenase
MASYVAKKTVQSILKSGKDASKAKVLVMGTTFKENVSDIRNSKVADLIHELKDFSIHVDVIDPHADSDELDHEYGYRLAQEVGTGYDAIIVAVNHKEYMGLNEDYFASKMTAHGLVVDLKGIYRKQFKQLAYWSL